MILNKKTIWAIIKKSYAKAAKDEIIKNNLSYREMTYSWNLEDIDFWFNVKIGQGKVTLSEGESKDSDMRFYNKKAEEFHRGNTGDMSGRDITDNSGFRYTGKMKHMRYISLLCKSMRAHYKDIAALPSSG